MPQHRLEADHANKVFQVYYMPTVLVKNGGLNPKLAQILGGCINIMFVIGSLLPSFMLDSMGRRKTLMWGAAGKLKKSGL